MQDISLQNKGLRLSSLKLGFGAEIQDLHRTPDTRVKHQKKGESIVASMSLGESELEAVWADDEVARETHLAKRG